MAEAVIVATARIPIGRAYCGAFNDTQEQTLAGHAIREAVRRAGVEPGEVDNVALGCALQQGSTGDNVARQAALWAGLSASVPGMTINRRCGSGLMAIATIAGNASQLSDGAAAVVLMDRGEAERRGIKPLGACRGMAVAGLFEIF